MLRDYAPSVIQTAKRVNILKSYRKYFCKWKRRTEKFKEVKPSPAEDKYVGTYLFIRPSETR